MKRFSLFILLRLGAIQVHAQTHPMYVNAAVLPMREKPLATSHTMIKLGAKNRVEVLDPAKGAWSQVMFSPYPGGELSWAGWVETKYLVAQRDSVKLPEGSFAIPKDEKVFPKRVVVKGVPPAARSYNGNVRVH